MLITLPHKYEPRAYQRPVHAALDGGIKRAYLIWHRRAGKDKTAWNHLIKETQKRVGVYFYVFPTYRQGKKALWDGIDGQGVKLLDHIPKALIKSMNATEMKIELTNGSLIQVVGSDNIDNLMSTNPVGAVFSEFALQDPAAWDYLSPIFVENDGWVIFVTTPRGRNHAFKLYEMALQNQEHWHVSLLGVKDTGVVSLERIERERREGKSDELINQEYHVSWDAPLPGAYYSREITAAYTDTPSRITKVPYQKAALVDTWWDIGVDDYTAIWFTQSIGREIHVIDFYQGSGEGLPHYARMLGEKRDKLGYAYGRHVGPHDMAVREFGSGKSRVDTALDLGIRFEVCKRHALADGIEAVRGLLPICYFDQDKCQKGIDALASYTKKFDEKNQQFTSTPEHNFASHGADAFRTLAMSHKWRTAVPSARAVKPVSGRAWS